MKKELKYSSLNELTFDTCDRLLSIGDRIESRNGMTYELINEEVILSNPRNRHLYLEGRKSNIYACLGEIFWIMSGTNELDPLMTFLLPRSVNFSDDGNTWQNGYGPKLYNKGNLNNVVQSFLQDGKNTRRSVMSIWTPETDTIESLKSKGIDKPKDVSCNNFLWFWIRHNRFNLKVGIRSNDCLWGLSAINVPEWTFLQEVILQVLKNEDYDTFKDVELGDYFHNVVSLHVYDETVKQAQDLVGNREVNLRRTELPNFPINMGNIKLNDLQRFFEEIYKCLCDYVTMGGGHSVGEIFDAWNVPKKGNQLYSYALLVEGYIINKKGHNTIVDLHNLSPDLRQAVLNNKFTPRKWMENYES